MAVVFFFFRELEFDGVTLTTDDFFYSGPSYDYDPSKLSDAHEWNQQRGELLFTSFGFLHYPQFHLN